MERPLVLSREEPVSSKYDPSPSMITAYNALDLTGLVALFFVLLPALFNSEIRRTRNKTWFSLIIAWTVYSLSYLLSFGRQNVDEPKPYFGICYIQAGLIYGVPALTSGAAACFMLEIFLGLTTVLWKQQRPKWLPSMLASYPWAIFSLCFFAALMMVGDSATVERDPSGMYCHVTGGLQPYVTAAFTLLASAIYVSLNIYTLVIIYRNWSLFRRIRLSRNTTSKRTEFSISTHVRMLAFTLNCLAAVAMTTVFVSMQGVVRATWDLSLQVLPLVAAMVFGFQKDIIGAWMFCRRKHLAAQLDLSEKELPPLPSLPHSHMKDHIVTYEC